MCQYWIITFLANFQNNRAIFTLWQYTFLNSSDKSLKSKFKAALFWYVALLRYRKTKFIVWYVECKTVIFRVVAVLHSIYGTKMYIVLIQYCHISVYAPLKTNLRIATSQNMSVLRSLKKCKKAVSLTFWV